VLSSLALTGIQAAASAGELLVLKSSTPGLQPGDVKESGSTIEVLGDAAATLVTSSGGVLRIDGPWRGRIEAAADDDGLIQQLIALFRAPPPRREVGATRALETCVMIDLEQDQDVCFGPSTCLEFESGDGNLERIMIEGPDLSPMEVHRSPVRPNWRWPRDLPLRTGVYRIQIDAGHRPAELRLHERPRLPSAAHEAAWMSEVGCKKQAWEALTRLGQ
jgi:hypothetical protein